MPVHVRRDWAPIIVRAAEIVGSYQTGVTLRQLYHRLVAEGLIDNTLSHYSRLARLTAEARRKRVFPALVDLGRGVERPLTFSSPIAAREWLADRYRRDRTQGQPWSIWLGVEKATVDRAPPLLVR